MSEQTPLRLVDRPSRRCAHVPPCPAADAPDHAAARVVAGHLEQGWSLLCNGVVIFDDAGEILPYPTIAPQRRDAGTLLCAA